MPRPSSKPEGIPKAITPTTGPSTDPLDQGDGVPAAQPRPAASRTRRDAQRPAESSGRAAAGAASEADRVPLPERQPSDAAPPDEGPLESLGKAVSAPVREAGRGSPGGRGGAPR